jgi:hypothetical protein
VRECEARRFAFHAAVIMLGVGYYSLGVHGKEDERDIFAACTLLIFFQLEQKTAQNDKSPAAHIIE